nr:Sua5/YciO/YrdC/YwlC family protein [Saccharothrix sp. CB00851]
MYGLGATVEDTAAVGRVFQVKGRPPSHPLIVHIGSAEQLGDWVADVTGWVRPHRRLPASGGRTGPRDRQPAPSCRGTPSHRVSGTSPGGAAGAAPITTPSRR